MTTFSIESQTAHTAAAIHRAVPMAELREVFDSGFRQVMEAITQQGLQVAGPPFGFYHRLPDETVEVSVGFPTVGELHPAGDVAPLSLPAGRAVVATHVGPYEDLERTYGELVAWAQAQGIELAVGMWEQYLSDPSAEPDPSTWRTLIVWPLAP